MNGEEKKYVDMSIGELDKEIIDEQEFANNCGVQEYTLRDIKKAEIEIKRQQEQIAEKKAEYIESIKINKEYMKKAQKKLKEANIEKQVEENFKANRLSKVKLLKRIRENLIKNPDYYKEVEVQND